MTVTFLRPRGARLRSVRDVQALPNGHGHGKWQSRRTLFAYKLATRKARNVAEDSRKRNRRTR